MRNCTRRALTSLQQPLSVSISSSTALIYIAPSPSHDPKGTDQTDYALERQFKGTGPSAPALPQIGGGGSHLRPRCCVQACMVWLSVDAKQACFSSQRAVRSESPVSSCVRNARLRTILAVCCRAYYPQSSYCQGERGSAQSSSPVCHDSIYSVICYS
jgi:hypothetical protein